GGQDRRRRGTRRVVEEPDTRIHPARGARGRHRPGDPPLQRAQADRAGRCLVNQKTFNALGVTAFVMVVLSVFVAFERPTVNFAFAKGSYLIKNLDPKEVATITIKSKNEEVKLDRMSDRFVVSSKMSYPAANK